jgi:hypothetical protein
MKSHLWRLGLGEEPAKAFFARGRVAVSAGGLFGTGGAGHVRLNLAASSAASCSTRRAPEGGESGCESPHSRANAPSAMAHWVAVPAT